MNDNDRKATMTKAYATSLRLLKNNHQEEFHAILEKSYADAGITVNTRLTGERKRQAEIEKHRAALNALLAEESVSE
jgi:hypothetical protein